MSNQTKDYLPAEGSVGGHAGGVSTHHIESPSISESSPIQIYKESLVPSAPTDLQEICEASINTKQDETKRRIEEGMTCVPKKQKTRSSAEQTPTMENDADMKRGHSTTGFVAEMIADTNTNTGNLLLPQGSVEPNATEGQKAELRVLTETVGPEEILVNPGSPQGLSVRPVSPQGLSVRPVSPQGLSVRPVSPQGLSVRPVSPQGLSVRPVSPQGLSVRPVSPQGLSVRPVSPQGLSLRPVSPQGLSAKPAGPQDNSESTKPQGTSGGPTRPQDTSVRPTSAQDTSVGPTSPEASLKQPCSSMNISLGTSSLHSGVSHSHIHDNGPPDEDQCITTNSTQNNNPCEKKNSFKGNEGVTASTLESNEEAERTTDVEHSMEDSSSYYENDFTKSPKLITGAWSEYDIGTNNFLKGCKWAPDGTCILTNSEDGCLRIFNLPQELYGCHTDNVPEMVPALKVQEAGLIYDYTWYPSMNSSHPETCCFASTSRGTPVHMWDAFTGKLRCSYRAYDQMDEITAAHSVMFSLDGMKLYCGFNKMIRVFDVTRPGRDFESRPTFVKHGQAGIISCIAMNPDQPRVYAAGSYSRSIGVYNEPSGRLECMFQGQVGGVTCIAFSPDGNRLYSGGRKDPEILCWDLRNPGNVLFSLQRQVQTNQRMYFDLDSAGQYLVSGSHDGSVLVWDTQRTTEEVAGQLEPTITSTLSFSAHTDTVNGISLHPSMPVLATASGQRKFPLPSGLDLESDSEEDTEMGGGDEEAGKGGAVDRCLRLWWVGA